MSGASSTAIEEGGLERAEPSVGSEPRRPLLLGTGASTMQGVRSSSE